MRVLLSTLFILSYCSAWATTYTFHTSGSYDDESNWDVYPGNILDNDDTIVLEEEPYNINLEVLAGTLIIESNVIYLDVQTLDISGSATLEIQSNILDIEVYDWFSIDASALIISSGDTWITLFNHGYYSLNDNNSDLDIYLYNYGTLELWTIETYDYVVNHGTIEVWGNNNVMYGPYELDLADGTFTGFGSYTLDMGYVYVTQYESWNTATFENCTQLTLDWAYITGTVVIED